MTLYQGKEALLSEMRLSADRALQYAGLASQHSERDPMQALGCAAVSVAHSVRELCCLARLAVSQLLPVGAADGDATSRDGRDGEDRP